MKTEEIPIKYLINCKACEMLNEFWAPRILPKEAKFWCWNCDMDKHQKMLKAIGGSWGWNLRRRRKAR